MALFGHLGKMVVMVVDRSGIHRAHKLASTLAHWQEQFRLHLLPAHCGHHLNPIEDFWRVMKEKIGAGRCFANLQLVYVSRALSRSPRAPRIHAQRVARCDFSNTCNCLLPKKLRREIQ